LLAKASYRTFFIGDSMKIVLVLLMVVGTVVSLEAEPIVQNYSFETPEFGDFWLTTPAGTGTVDQPTLEQQGGLGWTCVKAYGAGAGITAQGSSLVGDKPAQDGRNVGFMWQLDDSISQTIRGFEIGKTYTISWWEQARSGCSSEIDVCMDDKIILASHLLPLQKENKWTQRFILFTARAEEHILKFKNTAWWDQVNGWDRAAFIDSVSISDGANVPVDYDVNSIIFTNIEKRKSWPEKYPSPTPKQTFSNTLAEQKKELKNNILMKRFAISRKKLSADPYRPLYHFVAPESVLNDPHGLCFWQGRWHLFYQAYVPDEFPNPEDTMKRRMHWAHTVSDDLVHWHDLPYAIYPGIESGCWTGGTVVDGNQVVAFYPGYEAGQMVAVSKDPLLLNWEKIEGNPISRPGVGCADSSIWKENDTYFGLMGPRTLVASQNLTDWKLVNNNFLGGPSFPIDDGSCPHFKPIGDKYILFLFSHGRGGQYLLGDYDHTKLQFTPYEHGRFNHGDVAPGGVHAAAPASDGKGGVVAIFNINDGGPNNWDQIMSIVHRMTLGADKHLRIEPFEAITTLRADHQQISETIIPANKELVLDTIKGNTMELEVEIDPQMARWVQLNVLRSPDAEEQTSINFYNFDQKLSVWYPTRSVVCLDGLRSSILPNVWIRPPERAVIERGNEPLKLRVFIDRSVVEVYVNGKQYLAIRVYPGRTDSLGVSLRAQGSDAILKKLDSWQMKSIYNGDTDFEDN
jgi:beta-fructofuranosidase